MKLTADEIKTAIEVLELLGEYRNSDDELNSELINQRGLYHDEECLYQKLNPEAEVATEEALIDEVAVRQMIENHVHNEKIDISSKNLERLTNRICNMALCSVEEIQEEIERHVNQYSNDN